MVGVVVAVVARDRGDVVRDGAEQGSSAGEKEEVSVQVSVHRHNISFIGDSQLAQFTPAKSPYNFTCK